MRSIVRFSAGVSGIHTLPNRITGKKFPRPFIPIQGGSFELGICRKKLNLHIAKAGGVRTRGGV
jgi:hypothetical protein